MARLSGRIGRKWLGAALAGLTFFFLAAAWWSYHPRPGKEGEEIRYTAAAEQAARALAASGLDLDRLQHLDTPVTLQLGLGTARVWIGEETALRLASGPGPLLLAVESPEEFPRLFGASGPALREVFRWPAEGKAAVRVFANAAVQKP
jgi:hypothetical protein